MTDHVTQDEVAAFEARVMSVGHGVLSDSEWRRLIDTLNDAKREVYALRHANEQLAAKHRQLRLHVRKDGKLKDAQPKHVAEDAALHMTEKHGKQFDAYPCALCNGMWHVGHRRGIDPTEAEG